MRLLFHAKSLHLGLSRQLAIITTLHSKSNREPSKGKAVAYRHVKYLSLTQDAPQCTAIAGNRLNPASMSMQLPQGWIFSSRFKSIWMRQLFLYTPGHESDAVRVLSTCGDSTEHPQLRSGLGIRRRDYRCIGLKVTYKKKIKNHSPKQ